MFDSEMFGNNLRALRKELGLQRQLFADKCGISIYTLRSYQSGEIMPSMKAIINICNSFCISPNVLFEGFYKRPTEQESIAITESGIEALQDEEKRHVLRICETIGKCMAQSAPTLFNVSIGTRIKILREDIGLSQKGLAERCAVVPRTISCIESNQATPGIEVLLRACEAFRVSPEYMLCASLDALSPNKKFYSLTPRQIECFAELVQLLSPPKPSSNLGL